jgi:hypothetical protein
VRERERGEKKSEEGALIKLQFVHTLSST